MGVLPIRPQVCHKGQLRNGMASGCPINKVVRRVESRYYPRSHTSAIC